MTNFTIMPFLPKHPVLSFTKRGWLAVVYTAEELLVFIVVKSLLAKILASINKLT
jgi:hypothetical protein